MYFLYFLYSLKEKNVYVGCTNNLQRRIKEHNNGLVKSTKNRAPLSLIYSEKHDSLFSARRREDYLKSLYGARRRKEIIEECFKKYKLSPYTQTS